MGNGNCYCAIFNYFSKEKPIERNILDEAKNSNESKVQNPINDNLIYNYNYTNQNGLTGPIFSQSNDISSFNNNIYITNNNNMNIKKDYYTNDETQNFNYHNYHKFFLKNRKYQRNNYFPIETKNIKKDEKKVYNKNEELLILESLSNISQTQLITRSDIKQEIAKVGYNINEYLAIQNIVKRKNYNEFIPIPYVIIPKTIMNIMFQQDNLGICYLIAGINAFNEIPSIFDQLFIDKYYSENKKEYRLNAFKNSKMEVISLDDKFLYRDLGNNKIIYEGNQTFKYELFLKFIVKLFAELNKSNVEFGINETDYSYKKLLNIEGGTSSELYSCILGTSSLDFFSSKGKNQYINNIEKYINNPGNILATCSQSKRGCHQYAIKNMFEYSGRNGEKQKFITLFNPWGFGDPYEDEKYFFEKVQNESYNYDYIYQYNNNYSKSGLIKIPLNLFSNWFPEIEVCIPKYGFHYKVFSDYIERNISHLYCFYSDKKQNIEIELFLDELNNVRCLNKDTEIDIRISLFKIDQNLNISLIEKSLQSVSIFVLRKNAYIYRLLEKGNYYFIIEPIYFEKKGYEYNLRIGGEFDYLNYVSSDIIENLTFKYGYYFKIQNIDDYLVKSKYILLEKTYYDMKIYSIAKKIYNILYNPYENDVDIKIKNGIEEIISTISDAYDNNIYQIKKTYASNKNKIYYLCNKVKQLMPDFSETINNNELEILKIYQSLNDYTKNVEVFIRLPDDSSQKMTLDQLKEIITGPKNEKVKFYEAIRGYHIPQYGIDIDNIDINYNKKNYLKKKALEEMQNIFGLDKKLDQSIVTLCINDNIENEINYGLCDILFIVDSTESMKDYINICIKKCADIVERINFEFSYEINFYYGAIFYRDPIDQKLDDIHEYIPLTSNKTEFQKSLKLIKASGGGDYAEDWNGAYEIALNKINWSSDISNKIVVHIADASAHGIDFIEPGQIDKHLSEGPKFIKTIKKIAEKGLKIIGFPIGDNPPIHSFKTFKNIYEKNKGNAFCIYKKLLNIKYFDNITERAIKFIIDNS